MSYSANESLQTLNTGQPSQRSFIAPLGAPLLSAGITLLTYPGIEQSCVGLGSSWDPATPPIQPGTLGARPSSHPWLPCQLPSVGTGAEWWIEGSISWEGPERKARLLAGCREKENQHISWRKQFTAVIGLVVYQKLFCHNGIYNLHIFQKATQNSSHTQAALKDKSLAWKTCTIKLNMVIRIHNNSNRNELCKSLKPTRTQL